MFLKHAILIIFILLIIIIAGFRESPIQLVFLQEQENKQQEFVGFCFVLCLNIYFTSSLSCVFSKIQLVSGIFYLFGLPFLFLQGYKKDKMLINFDLHTLRHQILLP